MSVFGGGCRGELRFNVEGLSTLLVTAGTPNGFESKGSKNASQCKRVSLLP